jgi:hypothetical protein
LGLQYPHERGSGSGGEVKKAAGDARIEGQLNLLIREIELRRSLGIYPCRLVLRPFILDVKMTVRIGHNEELRVFRVGRTIPAGIGAQDILRHVRLPPLLGQDGIVAHGKTHQFGVEGERAWSSVIAFADEIGEYDDGRFCLRNVIEARENPSTVPLWEMSKAPYWLSISRP